MLKQETCKKKRKFPVTPPVVASNTGLENQYLLPVDSTQTGSDLSGHSTQQLLDKKMNPNDRQIRKSTFPIYSSKCPLLRLPRG